jgi:glycosyltransferase involved in cell wall biosynthesis
MPEISLVVPTINRVEELDRLFNSLCEQTFSDFDVVVVDQNNDNRVNPIIAKYSDKLQIAHIQTPSRGAARARNLGAKNCSGKIVGFPDDDCWYPPTLLAQLSQCFLDHPDIHGWIGILVDENGKPHNRWNPKKPKKLSLLDAFTQAAEPVIFFQRKSFEKVNGFDESLGVGAGTPWGAGEGTDLCVRMLNHKYQIQISPQLLIHHKTTSLNENDDTQNIKGRVYSRGMGMVVRKNQLSNFLVIFLLIIICRSFFWSIVKLNFNQAKYHLGRLIGLLEGYCNKVQ